MVKGGECSRRQITCRDRSSLRHANYKNCRGTATRLIHGEEDECSNSLREPAFNANYGGEGTNECPTFCSTAGEVKSDLDSDYD